MRPIISPCKTLCRFTKDLVLLLVCPGQFGYKVMLHRKMTLRGYPPHLQTSPANPMIFLKLATRLSTVALAVCTPDLNLVEDVDATDAV
jgi:hypothetical protein